MNLTVKMVTLVLGMDPTIVVINLPMAGSKHHVTYFAVKFRKQMEHRWQDGRLTMLMSIRTTEKLGTAHIRLVTS